jgi:ParB-like chromosome segregation protein Spo0J
VVAQDGTLVCGYQRYRVAKELGIEPPVRIREFKSKLEMLDYAIKDNLLRRNLSVFERALVALRYLPYAKKLAREHMSLGGRVLIH